MNIENKLSPDELEDGIIQQRQFHNNIKPIKRHDFSGIVILLFYAAIIAIISVLLFC